MSQKHFSTQVFLVYVYRELMKAKMPINNTHFKIRIFGTLNNLICESEMLAIIVSLFKIFIMIRIKIICKYFIVVFRVIQWNNL